MSTSTRPEPVAPASMTTLNEAVSSVFMGTEKLWYSLPSKTRWAPQPSARSLVSRDTSKVSGSRPK